MFRKRDKEIEAFLASLRRALYSARAWRVEADALVEDVPQIAAEPYRRRAPTGERHYTIIVNEGATDHLTSTGK